MSDDFKKFKVGYSSFDNLEDATQEASKRAAKDWDDAVVWQAVKLAKFTMAPGTVVLEDVQ
jgi:flavin-binding protein dodecin